ncbi:unnamed protein product [Lactuca saligna]|uniref:Uncharacterized protein n=1 Tax=Lactuca saligna TaxID=75948 RepID=A0AA35VC56_LACSI|nr:unnamed protein product [Lactuca saligna]
MVELKLEMAKDLQMIDKNYSALYGKVDVITDTMAKLVEYNISYSTQLDEKSGKDSKVFTQLEEFFIVELAPILELVPLLLTNAPPAKQVSKGGDKGCGCIGYSKDTDKGVVFGKVMSTQIATSLLISLTTTLTTTTTRPSVKGVIINESSRGSGSRSMPPTSKNTQGDKGKGIDKTPLEKQKKKQQALEIKRPRQINSILRRRQNDPPGLNKGDPNKHWCYETIEEIVLDTKFDYFCKAPKKSYEIYNSDIVSQSLILSYQWNLKRPLRFFSHC